MHVFNTRFPLLRFRNALHCGYSGITDIQNGLFFVLTRARTFKKSLGQVRDSQQQNIRENWFNIFIRGRYLYQWYNFYHNAKRYENVIRESSILRCQEILGREYFIYNCNLKFGCNASRSIFFESSSVFSSSNRLWTVIVLWPVHTVQ